jgi:hypothetical protein
MAILELVKEVPEAMRHVIRGLQALRGVAHISAVTIAAELGNVSTRFESARKLMGYCGVFPSENSSGKRKRQGGITKCGNAHLRRIVMESPWCYRYWPRVGEKLRKRNGGVPTEIIEIAWKAQKIRSAKMTTTVRQTANGQNTICLTQRVHPIGCQGVPRSCGIHLSHSKPNIPPAHFVVCFRELVRLVSAAEAEQNRRP